MQKITFEVCAGSYQDCLAAEKGGADRVELNSALSVGGLTPSLISLMRAKKETSIKIVCMVRPRAGGFCYDETEAQLMLEEAELLLEHGADGIAFGFLKADRTVDAEKTKKMVELIHAKGGEAVFHRAFDVTPEPAKAIETMIDCGVDRLLTSGQQRRRAQHCSQSFRISTEIRSNCWLEVVSTLEMYGNSWKRQAFVRYILPANPTAWILLLRLAA